MVLPSAMTLMLTTTLAASAVGTPCPNGEWPVKTIALREPVIAPCSAAAPAIGETFSGTVLEVLDGRTLCVAQGPTPDNWIRVQVSEAGGPDGRARLMAVSFAQRLTCVAGPVQVPGVLAECTVGGVPLASLLQDPTVTAEAKDWR